MREIKFRAWDPASKRYINEDWSISAKTGAIRGIYGEKFPELIPQQYTGLKDSEGKEIYEGDVLKIPTITRPYSLQTNEDLIYVPVYRDGHLFSEVKFTDGMFMVSPFASLFGLLQSKQKFSIAGNVYENPGLLKS